MAEKGEKSAMLPYAEPYYMGSSYQSNASLGSILFNGTNYNNWSKSVRMALGAKNKLGFIDGTLKKHSTSSSDHNKWVRNDCLIRCWLSASVTPRIAEQMLVVDSAKEFWDELTERYRQSNAAQLYMLKKELNRLQQNNISLTEYFTSLKNYWDELNSVEGFPECVCGGLGKCTCNIMKKLTDREAKNRVIDFLMGLNGGYDNMKENILGMEPLPNVNKAYHMVMQVEKQKEIFGSQEVGVECSALAASKQNFIHSKQIGVQLSQGNNYYKRETKEEIMKKKCEHCQIRGHTKDQCFKILGYTEWYKTNPETKPGNKFVAHVGHSTSEGAQETPLDVVLQREGGRDDAGMVSTVVQEVLKIVKQQQPSTSSGTNMNMSNVAGKISTSNAYFLLRSF